ncbi:MAG: hypothetical protein ABIP80_06445 [Ferruginibacter sp.]
MKNLIVVLLLLTSIKVDAQNAASIQKERMKGLAIWAGTWRGEGWMILPDGKKHLFTQKEVVNSKFDGRVLTVEGSGKDKETGKPVHDALGYFTFDVIKQQYKFTAMTGMGYITDVVPEIINEGFVWTLKNSPLGIMKYTIKLSKSEWVETGENSKDDGKTWMSNFEMKLKKN